MYKLVYALNSPFNVVRINSEREGQIIALTFLLSFFVSTASENICKPYT